ncbi:keratin, type I cytoskeletal 13-like [Conger conger]|uniref:keratin, type I cytoskeletal 13-like n=1 Tax=Conger conger TaxID=82655 RepID=UPI002A59CE65|nr:keratin, type I cytoskeletal 13-like [Conger conger]
MAGSTRGGGMSRLSHQSGSVYGGAGGHGTRVSTSVGKLSSAGGGGGGFSFGALGGGGGGGGGGGAAFSLESALEGSSLPMNEKQAMQGLNDRLARYLERVRTLEAANAKLEEQIRSWGLSRTKVTTQDMSAQRLVIRDLRSQILAAAAVNLEINLQIDNVKLAADDFKIKYENELSIRQCVEADIVGLKKMMSELTLGKRDVELQLEGVKEEIAYLTKNHEEETMSFQVQLGGQVQVEVNAAPAVDLTTTIDDIRDQYETLVAKNHRDIEAWFKNKSEAVQQEIQVTTEVLQTSNVELRDSQSSMRTLELELQALLSMKASLEGTLAETEARHGAQMFSLQASVTGLEQQLVQLKANIENNSYKYEELLQIKMRLEMEIAEYRRLLEGGDIGYTSESSVVVESSGIGMLNSGVGMLNTGVSMSSSGVSMSSSAVGLDTKLEPIETAEEASSSVTITKKVVTVVEELVDGVVVSSSSSTSNTVIADSDAPGQCIVEGEEVSISPVPE